jgi:hypothetical protein
MRCAIRPELIIVFVGVHPVFMQVPPTHFLSIRATFQLAAASFLARGLPPWPEPMMMASYFVITLGVLCKRKLRNNYTIAAVIFSTGC